MLIAGIDPGPEKSAIVLWDSEQKRVRLPEIHPEYANYGCVYAENEEIERCARGIGSLWGNRPAFGAIEWLMSYQKVVGQAVFHTCRWVGRFEAAFRHRGVPVELITNVEVRQNLCRTVKCGQPQITLALIERFGGSRAAAVGTKKQPGPLYGVKSHLWSALAVAVTLADRLGKAPRSL